LRRAVTPLRLRRAAASALAAPVRLATAGANGPGSVATAAAVPRREQAMPCQEKVVPRNQRGTGTCKSSRAARLISGGLGVLSAAWVW
jgi:hypothetical protein